MVDQHPRIAAGDGGGITLSTADRRLVRVFWPGNGCKGVSGSRLVDGTENVTAALGHHGTFTRMRGRMPPTCVTGDHKRFQTGNGAGDDDVIFMDLHPDTGHHSIECWVRGEKLNVEVMETEDDEGNDPDPFLDSFMHEIGDDLRYSECKGYHDKDFELERYP